MPETGGRTAIATDHCHRALENGDAYVAQLAIEALDKRVLDRLAGRDVTPCEPSIAVEVNSVPLNFKLHADRTLTSPRITIGSCLSGAISASGPAVLGR